MTDNHHQSFSAAGRNDERSTVGEVTVELVVTENNNNTRSIHFYRSNLRKIIHFSEIQIIVGLYVIVACSMLSNNSCDYY